MPEEIHPTISIIIPVFNRAEILEDTLKSIVNQPGNWECILVDDHSTDDAPDVCRKWLAQDDRFRFMTNRSKKGAPGARNTGVQEAQGKYIFFFDSDNILHERALEKIIGALEKRSPDVLVFYGRVLNEQGERVNDFHWKCEGYIQNDLINGKTYVDNNLSVIRKECIEAIGLTDEAVPSYQEWDTHIRLSVQCKYDTLEEELIDYIKWEKDTISSNVKRSIEGFLYVLEKHMPLFTQHENALLSFCMQIEELSKKVENSAEQAVIMARIKALLPNYSKKAKMQQFKTRYRILVELVRRKLSFK